MQKSNFAQVEKVHKELLKMDLWRRGAAARGLQQPASGKAEALKCAEKADPRVDLERMRIRYERVLNKR
jgi:hypothetical protein